MAKKIDWMYHRKGCETCKKATGYFEKAGCSVAAIEDAAKSKHGPDTALDVLKGADRMVAMKGAKIVSFDLKKDRPDDETLLAHLIGPTGNLRAPTMRVGKTIVVGFNADEYAKHFG
jgi:arsenate reductase-like glutaredoxin family protein